MKNGNKIVFVSNFFGNGGAARVIDVLSNGFANKGCDVYVISYSANDEEYPKRENVKYIKISPKGKGVIYKINRIRELRKQLKRFNGATVIAFENFVAMQTIVASRGLKQRVIISERCDPALKDGEKLFCFMRKVLYKKADVSVFQTPEAKNYFNGKIRERGVVIPNPISGDLPDYNGKNSSNIINFCRLVKQKNLPLLIDAFGMLLSDYPQNQLHIYGDGSEKSNVEAYIKSKNLENSVMLFPSISNIHEVASNYKVFASSSDYEGISNSMLEAMGIGLPCVCTDCPCGGAHLVIKNGENGILTEVGNVNELYFALKKIFDDAKFAEFLSENAKSVRIDFSVDRIVEKWYELL